MEPSVVQWAVLTFCAILIGFSKTGVPTLGILVAAILASTFPTRESVGLMLPILITGDLMAIIYYRNTVVWRYIAILIPWVLAGVITGFFVLGRISNDSLAILIGSLVLLLIILFQLHGKIERTFQFSFLKSKAFNAVLGALTGFTTMIGNSAGSIMSIYLLSKGIEKKSFIGTNAYFFFIVNLVKVPFLIYLGMISSQSIVLNVWVIPAVVLGALIGIKVLPQISQRIFEKVILGFAAIGALYLIFG